MALPAVRAVREKFNDAEIGIVGRPYVLDIYREQEIADELIAYDSAGEHKGISGRERLAGELRERKFDVAVLLQNACGAAWLAWRAKIPTRIGYARDGRSLLLTNSVAVPKLGEIPVHEKFYYLELIRRTGWIEELPDIPWIELKVSVKKRQHAEELLLNAGTPAGRVRIAVGAGASYGSAKCWPPDRFATTLNALAEKMDADVVLFGTSGEASVSAAIKARLKHAPVDLTGKTAIVDLPALLSGCNLFIGNDSGAMHVAAAVGLPVVAGFCAPEPEGTESPAPPCFCVAWQTHCH